MKFHASLLVASLLTLVFVLALGVTAAQAQTKFAATINGAQANAGAGTGSLATGSALLTLNEAQNRLEIEMTILGIDFPGGVDTAANNATLFHIHRAAAGANGPVVFGFISPNSDTNGDLVITPFVGGATIFSAWDAAEGNNTTLAPELDDLFNEGLYINLHTNVFGGGEIRGQIVQIPEPSTAMLLAIASTGLLYQARRRKAHAAAT